MIICRHNVALFTINVATALALVSEVSRCKAVILRVCGCGGHFCPHPRAYLATSGDIFDRHNQGGEVLLTLWLEAGGAAKHRTGPSRALLPSAHPPPSAQNYPGQNITSADVHKPSCKAKLID